VTMAIDMTRRLAVTHSLRMAQLSAGTGLGAMGESGRALALKGENLCARYTLD
jgi:hypothetical protein